ncbi:hypothetical protein Cgig2_016175 [Carnegiea gigantea]|uniref:Homeobox domain-containing protein n=1 Tax=Carnegiea gigantea TaxID=171969 RepID=A0A9Q1QNS6_9CARY|nr:hypothetical protein Cgig2_016175 [Carnegiea gigantea]
MEESSEVQYEENKELPEKNKRRRFKTPSQLQALEEFYNEHKYPTESMKAELAEKLGLTEKQVSGWFCHRRLKDKRLLKDEANAAGRPDLSSGVQDRGSGLKQDSCSSTKQGDYMVADLREVESRRFCRNDRTPAEVNYEARGLYDGTELDDTSSESSSDLRESFYHKNRNPLDIETTKCRAPNGFVAKDRGRVGPSGYLKIKGQTENAAITAVKRQLGRLYREDGPPLGIEFDPLPPRAFESPSKSTNNDAYRVHQPIVSGSGLHKRPGLSTKQAHKIWNDSSLSDTTHCYWLLKTASLFQREPITGIRLTRSRYTVLQSTHPCISVATVFANQDVRAEAANYKPLQKSEDDLPRRQTKQKQSLPNQSHVFPGQKPSFGIDSYSAGEISEYDAGINHFIQRKRDLSGMKPDPFSELQPQPYGGKGTREAEEPWLPSYDNMNPKIARRRQRLDFKAAPPTVRPKDPVNIEDRVPPSRIAKDEEVYVERRPIKDHHDSIRLKKRPTNEFRAGKRGREEFLREDYAVQPSPQELSQWSRQIKEPTAEMPSSFSEDETAETSSSAD